MAGAEYLERQARSFFAAADAAPTKRDAEAFRQLGRMFESQLNRRA